MNKFDMITDLDKLPDDIAEKTYYLELIDKKCLLHYNGWLKDKYKEYRIILNDPDYEHDFMEFRINGWRVIMETAN